MKTFIFSTLLLALGSEVHGGGAGPFSNWLRPAPDEEFGPLPVPPDLIVYHGQHPNVSRSATFHPFKNAWADLGPDSVLRNAEWTWRVNVSQFYAPYNGSEVAEPSDRQAFVSQTYDFSWSGDTNISEALDGDTGLLCITKFQQMSDLPVNVTNALIDGTSCVPAFGQACVDAILNLTPAPTMERGCRGKGPANYISFNTLAECSGSFGPYKSNSNTVGVGFDLGNATEQIDSGNTFWVNTSGPVLGDETWLYEKVANQISFMLLTTTLPTSKEPNASTVTGKELLCLRANNTQLPDVDVNQDGIALVGEVVLLSAGTSTIAGISSFMFLRFVVLMVAVVFG
ncbi:hypothetical protein NUW58_g709 [Xylaria curta]|uniref:Uncharacterized protein n=1 Tax=Xylaria curta TaxID=42375 RepID=A0ACC1PQT4_9PEZI|nr:hypothetical protein NUW58_g709 [Xylaria curta]